MNILWWRFPSPGIDPRIPIALGCRGVSQTSIVAQRSVERRSERGGEAAPALPVSPASARHVPATLAVRQLAHGKPVMVRPTRATIAPRACAREGDWGTAVISLAKMAGTGSQDVVELLQRVPVFQTLETGDLERIAQLAVP